MRGRLRGFPFCGHVRVMTPAPPPEPPGVPGLALWSGQPDPLTPEALYRERWRYVLRVLPGFGIWGKADIWDVAQTVWLTVHQRIESYDPAIYKTPRAWLTGIAWRCALRHRRSWRRR